MPIDLWSSSFWQVRAAEGIISVICNSRRAVEPECFDFLRESKLRSKIQINGSEKGFFLLIAVIFFGIIRELLIHRILDAWSFNKLKIIAIICKSWVVTKARSKKVFFLENSPNVNVPIAEKLRREASQLFWKFSRALPSSACFLCKSVFS